jgi:hypothetical protein
MWPFRKGKVPKSFYEKGCQLLKQANGIADTDAKKLALEAARAYYEADMQRREPFALTLLLLLVPYAVIFVGGYWAFTHLEFYKAFGVVLSSFVAFAFLVGTALRTGGYISEKTFWGIFKEGLRALLLIRNSKSSHGN